MQIYMRSMGLLSIFKISALSNVFIMAFPLYALLYFIPGHPSSSAFTLWPLFTHLPPQ